MLAKDSTSWIAFVGIFALAGAIASFLTGLPSVHYVSYAAFALFIFLIWFFRDPERTTKICDHCLFSAADGKVIDISNIKQPKLVHAYFDPMWANYSYAVCIDGYGRYVYQGGIGAIDVIEVSSPSEAPTGAVSVRCK